MGALGPLASGRGVCRGLSKVWALPDDRRIWTAYAALIALLTMLTFGSLGDLLLDTHEDEIFRDHVLADGLGYFFQSAAEKEFNSPGRPATEIARYLGYLIWGNDPGAFHLYCAGVHALASLLLAVAARSLGATLGVSLLGGLLFLLNVGHFRGVHYISGLDYPLAQVGSVAAAICYARYARERRTLWLVACGVCLVLGTASHQAAVMVLPFLWYWSWAQGRDAAAALKPLGLILLLEVYLLLQITDREGATTWVSLRQLATDSPIATIPAMGRVLLWLAGRLFTTAHWLPLTVYEQQGWEIYFGGLVFAGLGILVWRRMDLPGIWAAWISLSLLPFIMVSEEILHGLGRIFAAAGVGLAAGGRVAGRSLRRGRVPALRRDTVGPGRDELCAVEEDRGVVALFYRPLLPVAGRLRHRYCRIGTRNRRRRRYHPVGGCLLSALRGQARPG